MCIAFAATGLSACQAPEQIDVTKQAPRLISVVPSNVWNGCTAIISGIGFSEVADENVVTVDGQQVAVSMATSNRLTLTMPEHADGKAVIAVSVNGLEADTVLETNYTQLPELVVKVTGITPAKGFAGDLVTISGENFSTVPSENLVTFGDVPATVESATSTTLKVIAPEHPKGAVNVKIVTGGKTLIAPSQFTFMVFSISTVAPTMGGSGDEVTLTGEGFSPVAEENTVLVNGQPAVVKSASETQLVIIMPDNPEGKYDFTVTVAGKTITGGQFTYGGSWRVKTLMGATTGTNADVAGTGLAARIKNGQDIVASKNGFYWITVRGNHGIWKMTKNGDDYSYSKVAAIPDVDLLDKAFPWGADEDSQGNLYLACKADNYANSRIVICSQQGVVTKYEITDASGASVSVPNAMKVLVDKNDVVYVLARGASAGTGFVIQVKNGVVQKKWDLNHVSKLYELMCFNADESKILVFGNDSGDIVMIDTASEAAPVRVAGTGTKHEDANTFTDGTPGQPLTATVRQTEGAICDPNGIVYFTDIKGVVRTFVPDENGDYSKGTITTIAGQPYVAAVKDGAGTGATFYYPAGICLGEDSKTLYMIDGTTNGTVRKIYYK